LFAAVALGTIPATVLTAQAPTRAQLDTLAMRLEDAEAMIELLRQQLATESEMAIRTRSRAAFEFNGRILMNAFMNSKETNNADVPMYRREVPDGSPKGGMGMAIRQTTLGGAVTVQSVLGGTFLGDIDVDFFGGQMPTTGGRTFPLMRIRTARATVEWENSTLMIGQEQPLVSNINPLSLAAVGTPNFSYAGNLWHWIPQIRYGVHTSGRIRTGVAGAVLAPMSGEPFDVFTTSFDRAERTNMPSLQGRVHVGWGDEENASEIGFGYHTGKINDVNEVARTSSAITADFLLPIGSRFEFRGEAFAGQALAGLGGGGIGQNFGADSVTPIRTVGGWVQFNAKLTPRLLVGAGYGFDKPNEDDVPRLLENATQEVHVHWRPAGPLVFGLEYRTTGTRYNLSNYSNTHINLAFGFEF
jgi:hypothetical protein